MVKKGQTMRQFKTVRKKVVVEITSKEINIPENFVKEIAKSIEDEIDFQELINLKGSDIDLIGSRKYAFNLEDLMDMAYTDPDYETRNQKKLGFFSDKKPFISGSTPRDRKEPIKIFPLPEKPYVKDEKVFNEPFLFWSKEWECKPKKKSLSSKVEVFKSIDDYNRSDRRVGEPII